MNLCGRKKLCIFKTLNNYNFIVTSNCFKLIDPSRNMKMWILL